MTDLAPLAGLFGVLTLGLLSPGPDFLLILRNSLGPTAARGLGTVAGIGLGLAQFHHAALGTPRYGAAHMGLGGSAIACRQNEFF